MTFLSILLAIYIGIPLAIAIIFAPFAIWLAKPIPRRRTVIEYRRRRFVLEVPNANQA